MALLAVCIGFTLYVLKKYGEAGWKDIISRAILPPFLLGVEIAVLSAIEYTFIMQDGKGPFLGINPFMFLFFSSVTYLLAMAYYVREYGRDVLDSKNGGGALDDYGDKD